MANAKIQKLYFFTYQSFIFKMVNISCLNIISKLWKMSLNVFGQKLSKVCFPGNHRICKQD